MKLLATLGMLIALLSTAEARIGDSPEQIQERYGRPVQTSDAKYKDTQEVGYVVLSDDAKLIITVTYFRGKAIREVFGSPTKEGITEAQIEKIKTVNGLVGASMQSLKKGAYRWKKDGNTMMILVDDDLKTTLMVVQSDTFDSLTEIPTAKSSSLPKF